MHFRWLGENKMFVDFNQRGVLLWKKYSRSRAPTTFQSIALLNQMKPMQKNFMTITQAKLKWFRDEIKYNYRFPQSYRYLRAFVVTFTGIQKKLTQLVSEATFFTFHILKPIPVGRKCKQKQTSKYHSSCALKEARKPLQVLKRAKIISNCDLSPNFFWITYSNR